MAHRNASAYPYASSGRLSKLQAVERKTHKRVMGDILDAEHQVGRVVHDTSIDIERSLPFWLTIMGSYLRKK